VVVDVQRAGPGLGNIWPEQSDYKITVKGGGHGNYRNIVLAPHSAQEMCDFTYTAFELADKYRITVIVLADAYIGQMMEPVEIPRKLLQGKRKDWALYGDRESRNSLVTSILMDPRLQSEHNWKLQEKYERIAKESCQWDELETDDADYLFVAYGITSRICHSAVEELREKGIRAGLLRPKTLNPFPEARLRELSSRCKTVISAELAHGMMADDVERIVSGRCPVRRLCWLGGVIPSVQEITSAVEELAEGGSL